MSVKTFVDKELRQNLETFSDHQMVLKQNRNFFLVRNETERARNFLRAGFSYDEIRKEVIKLTQWKELAIDGVLTNRDSALSILNLHTTSRLLAGLLERTDNRLTQILKYNKSLGELQFNLDSLVMDSVLYRVPADSAAMAGYIHKLTFLSRDIKPVNRDLKVVMDSIQALEIRVNLLKFGIESDINETESLNEEFLARFKVNELDAIGRDTTSYRPVTEIISYSVRKNLLALLFYSVNRIEDLILLVLFIIGTYLYLVVLRRKVRSDQDQGQIISREIVIRHPLASSAIMVITVFHFILPLPPFIFTGLLWIISAGLLTLVTRESTPRFLFQSWLLFILLFLPAFFSNMVLRPSSFERWAMLIISLTGLTAGIFLLVVKRNRNSFGKIVFVSIVLMVLFQLLSVYFNLTGAFSLAKIFMTNSIFTIIIVVLLFWAARMILATQRISNYFFQGTGGKNFSLSGEPPTDELPRYAGILIFAGWLFLALKGTFYFQTQLEPIRAAFTATRTIGEFTFDYKSIFIFLLILVLSSVISRLVSILASDIQSFSDKPKKGGIGSWLLLIRISIITAGVLVAFIAAGFPMDRIAIILGAMSVGIGFGLQTLVNNLISGLVIAFEKPVNVGDVVEFAGQTGRMKSIGVRSSVVTTWDGADMIIPNGDLLNQHLINWTLGNSTRRVDLNLGVAYGTDLAKTHQLLLDLMLQDHRILKYPMPFVLATTFNSSSVDLSLKFWVAYFDIGLEVKSDLIVAIDAMFREHGIVIPFPQQDVHVRGEIRNE